MQSEDSGQLKGQIRRLKIALLATVVEFGGAEKVIISLLENIDPELFDVVPIIYTRHGQSDSLFFRHLKRLNKRSHIICVNKFKLKYVNPIANIVETYRILKRNRFDLLHTHGYRADFIGAMVSKMTGHTLISTCHGFIGNDSKLRLYNRLDGAVLRSFLRIIAVSEGIKDTLICRGVDEKRIEVIQNAVDIRRDRESFYRNRQIKRRQCHIAAEDFVIGYIGRLSKEKGIKYLIGAGSLLKESGIPATILIIGEGPQRKELEALIRGSNVEDRIIFTGFQDQVGGWLPAFDAFVLPSLTEGTPMSLLEAMAMGIPVIASAVGGIPKIVRSGDNGILVTPGDPQALRDAVINLYDDEQLRNRLAANGQRTVEEGYELKGWAKKIESEYLKLESGPAGARV